MRTFICSDFHGHYDLYEKIKATLQPEDKVIFLGDAADRGPNGWKLIKAILADPQWIYIKGNHDVMLYESILGPDRHEAASLHRYNGGKPTIDAMNKETFDELKRVATALKECPSGLDLVRDDGLKIFVSHSGSTSNWLDDRIWDRTHYYHPIDKEEKDCDVVIHGHTPWFYIEEDRGENGYLTDEAIVEGCKGTYWYEDNTKCCIDLCTILTKKAVLLNLDTFEEQIFTSEE